MTQYEQTLSKIAPIFYKLVQHQSYSSELIESYLWHARVPVLHYVSILRIKNINYYYYVDIYFYLKEKKPKYIKKILLTTKNKATISDEGITLSEFIVSMIINKFSFENEPGAYFNVLNELFIALVGKDTYETIKNNIK